MTSLLIVESPAKCGKIQGFLGPGWRVIATMGHIRALEEDLDAVGLTRDFEPRFAFLKEKSKAINQIKEAAAGAKTIYLASDDDREGEAISYSVAVLLKLDPATTPRAVFREITTSAVKAAVAAPRRLDMARVHAQQARAVLDMMVGFTISPLLWKYVGQGLSAGRCQTPALRLLCDKERDITSFKADTSWRVSGKWLKVPHNPNVYTPFEADMVEELEDETSAENYLENLHNDMDATVTSAVTRPTKEQPPKPLITSTLQQEVSATMGIQPKNTMRIAQRLYEAGHITYMRTDSAVLSEEARLAAEALVRKQFGEAYVAPAVAVAPTNPSAVKKENGKGKGNQQKEGAGGNLPPQEAHEAIRPTHFELTDLPADEDWNGSDRKVYKLIWNRAVQSTMAAAEGEQRTVDFTAAGDPGAFGWRAQWRRTTFPGWRRIGAAATNLDKEDGSEDEAGAGANTGASAWAAAQALTPGTTLQWRTLAAAPFESRPPARYTEATLVRELEKRGIGRPSTFAQLVGTILDKAYAEKRDTAAREVKVPRLSLDAPGQWPPTAVEQVKKVGAERQKLAPTPLGLSVVEFLEREFAALFAYTFTAEMEGRLDAIASGSEPWKQLCRDTWGSYSAKLEAMKGAAGPAGVAGPAAKERMFAGGIKAVQSKKGPLLLKEEPAAAGKKSTQATFYGWPEGVAFGAITEEQVAAFVASKAAGRAGEEVGAWDGELMVKKSGPFGAYVECKGVKVPWKEEDTEETLVEKLVAKSAAGGALHTLGPFEFRRGPYGVYFFKKESTGAARKFVGLPEAVDPKTLTLAAATKLFQDGLQAKAKAKAYGASGGGTRGGAAGGGRGGFRGGRGGKAS
jgi:DNA topoisomerase-1